MELFLLIEVLIRKDFWVDSQLPFSNLNIIGILKKRKIRDSQ